MDLNLLKLVRSGDLFFTTSKSWISVAIRARTWGQFSHVQIVTGVFPNALEVVSADAEAVVCRNVRPHEWNQFAILTCPELLPDQRAGIVKFCASQIGKAYDFIGLSSFLIYKEMQEADKWFCSELAYVAYKSVGVRLQRRVKQDFISPRDLYISPSMLPVVMSSEYDWV